MYSVLLVANITNTNTNWLADAPTRPTRLLLLLADECWVMGGAMIIITISNNETMVAVADGEQINRT
jgi:hypothetical protein